MAKNTHWLDQPTKLLAQHETLVAILGGIWFWTGIAIYARFIELPDLPRWLSQGFFWAGVAANAIWWGFLRPAILKRREALREPDQNDRIEES